MRWKQKAILLLNPGKKDTSAKSRHLTLTFVCNVITKNAEAKEPYTQDLPILQKSMASEFTRASAATGLLKHRFNL